MGSFISLMWFLAVILFINAAYSTSDFPRLLSSLKLSPTAKTHLRGTPGYVKFTERWQYWEVPDVEAVVEIATTSDVAETVRFANTHGIPFTAQSGGHGGIESLGKVKEGLQINLRHLNTVELSSDGTYAIVGGGTKGKELSDALWSHNKWSLHGLCECPGVTAVALGGGHGLLQGRYGLPSDQIISLEVVLANGTMINVSEKEHAELFWGMCGAGHNFGIVTKFKYRIHDVPDKETGGRTWSTESFVWEATTDNIRKVYALAKDMIDSGTQPDGLMHFGFVGANPKFGNKIYILHHVIWNGPLSSIRQFSQPYYDLGPVMVIPEEGTFQDLPRFISTEEGNVPCNPSQILPRPAFQRYPVDMKTYNLDALVETVKEFTKAIVEQPEFSASFMMIEQYPVVAVKGREGEGAVPWRQHVILLAPSIMYSTIDVSTDPPTPKSYLDEEAKTLGLKLRKILADGTKDEDGYYSYVNYAYGGEDPGEIYGRENLKRLRALKKLYDPDNRFRFYGPIVSDNIEKAEHSEL